MIIKGYEEKLDDRDIRYINYVIDKSTMADAIESYIYFQVLFDHLFE
jgi:hypothetical protein